MRLRHIVLGGCSRGWLIAIWLGCWFGSSGAALAQECEKWICIVGDTNRDGYILYDDHAGRAQWNEDRGAIFNVNLDADEFDEDTRTRVGSIEIPRAGRAPRVVSVPLPDAIHFADDGRPRDEDYLVRNEDDFNDLTPFRIELPAWEAGDVVSLENLSYRGDPIPMNRVHVYQLWNVRERHGDSVRRSFVNKAREMWDGGRARPLQAIWGSMTGEGDLAPPSDSSIVLDGVSEGHNYFALEGLVFRWIHSAPRDIRFNGYLRLRATLRDRNGKVVARDTMEMKVAPWLMLSVETQSEEVFAAYNSLNAPLREDLVWRFGPSRGYTGLGRSGQLSAIDEGYRDNQWFQDHVEIGYTKRPVAEHQRGGGEMHVAFRVPYTRGRRVGLPTWPHRELLYRANTGLFTIGANFGAEAQDYGGNLEIFSSERNPNGRIVVGVGASDELEDFLGDQEVQVDPEWVVPESVPVTWLTVGHIDETVSFLDKDRVAIADSALGWRTLRESDALDSALLFCEDKSPPITGTTREASQERRRGRFWVTRIRLGAGSGLIDRLEENSRRGEPHLGYMRFFDGPSEAHESVGLVGEIDSYSEDSVFISQWWKGCVIDPSENGTRRGAQVRVPGEMRFVYCLKSKKKKLKRNQAKAPAFVTKAEILSSEGLRRINEELVPRKLRSIERILGKENMGVDEFIRIPALFTVERHFSSVVNGDRRLDWVDAFFPNPVNLQLLRGEYYVPRPFGPVDSSSRDIFEEAISGPLLRHAGGGAFVFFVDDFELYHSNLGEVHCGSNVKRAIPRYDWWSVNRRGGR